VIALSGIQSSTNNYPLRLHGTSDVVYSVANAQEDIKLFTASKDARVQVVQDGQHFLSFSHPKEVADALIKFVKL